MKNETITIALANGKTDTRIARPTPCPGLAITGDRGHYVITHVPSGYAVITPSIFNTNATIKTIQDAMMMAQMTVMQLGTMIDWTVDGHALDRVACRDWCESFARHVASGR